MLPVVGYFALVRPRKDHFLHPGGAPIEDGMARGDIVLLLGHFVAKIWNFRVFSNFLGARQLGGNFWGVMNYPNLG